MSCGVASLQAGKKHGKAKIGFVVQVVCLLRSAKVHDKYQRISSQSKRSGYQKTDGSLLGLEPQSIEEFASRRNGLDLVRHYIK